MIGSGTREDPLRKLYPDGVSKKTETRTSTIPLS